MNLSQKIFSKNEINTNRQIELDFGKAVIIFFLAFIHCTIECTSDEGLKSGIPYIFDSIIGGPLAAPMFMFAMGIGITYSKKNSPRDIAKRGLKIGIINFIFNIIRFAIPYLFGYIITNDYEHYIEPLEYHTFGNDVLLFASLAMLFMALLIHLKISPIAVFSLGLIMSFISNFLNGIKTDSNTLNIFLGYFVGVEDSKELVMSYFPFLNWFIVPASGYVFGKILRKVKNKNLFYISISPACTLITVIYFFIRIKNRAGMFGEGQNCYYHIQTNDILISLSGVIGILGIYHFIAKIMPKFILKIISEISENITAIYCIHWIFIVWITNVVIYILKNTQEINYIYTMLLSLAISIVSIIIAHYWKRFKSNYTNKKNGRNTIIMKLFSTMIISSVIFITITSLIISVCYRYNKIKDYTSHAYSYAKTISEYVDSDKVLNYLATDENGEYIEKDDYYYEILNYLNIVQKNSDLKYFYIFAACEDDLVYIWDADTLGDNCELGEHEEYLEGGKETLGKILENNDIKYNVPPLFSKTENYGTLASIFYPIYNSDNEAIAFVGIDYSVPEVISYIFKFIFLLIILIIVLVFTFIFVIYKYEKRRILYPIKKLNNIALNMINNLENEQNINIDIHTNDEIEELAISFVHMNHEIRDYIEKLSLATAEKEKLGAELNIATQIQANMLPNKFPVFPDRNEFDIFALMRPAKKVGGDFYDFFFIDDDHLALVIADVSDKGIPAALFMVIAKTLIKNRTLLGGTPAEIMYDVNNQLCEENDAGMFVTAWLCIVEISTGNCIASNAGHEYPAIRRGNGNFEFFKQKHSPAIATMNELSFKQYKFKLEKGDCIYVYTDGITEATDSNNKLFGTKRLLNSLNTNPNSSPEELLNNVQCGISKFIENAPQFDDITMLCFEYFGKDNRYDRIES